MLRPPLVFMHVEMLVDDPVISFPELGQVHELDAEEEMKLYESHGMAIAVVHGPCVVSLPEGSEHSLHILDREISRSDVLCISVRRVPGTHRSWWLRLEDLAKEHGVTVVEHNRHDINEAVAYRQFTTALRALEDAADLVRSEGIETSNEAMRTEKALTRAIETLKGTGFRTPRKR